MSVSSPSESAERATFSVLIGISYPCEDIFQVRFDDISVVGYPNGHISSALTNMNRLYYIKIKRKARFHYKKKYETNTSIFFFPTPLSIGRPEKEKETKQQNSTVYLVHVIILICDVFIDKPHKFT